MALNKIFNSSCSHSFTENIRKSLDGGNVVCGIFVGLTENLDTVEHDILLSKLEHYSIHGFANELMNDLNLISQIENNMSQFIVMILILLI